MSQECKRAAVHCNAGDRFEAPATLVGIVQTCHTYGGFMVVVPETAQAVWVGDASATAKAIAAAAGDDRPNGVYLR